jgi:hypothetical protein
MSATNRGAKRETNDAYPTPAYCIKEFLNAFFKLEKFSPDARILDPCCGQRPYSIELQSRGFKYLWNVDIDDTVNPDDVCDYLNTPVTFRPHIIISNPPYSVASQFIEKSLHDVNLYGYVAFLLRLNFFGSQKRKPFFDKYPPKYCFVHSKRPSFKGGGTDATEYAHFVWQQGYYGMTKLKVL